MQTRWQAEQATRDLRADDLIYLADGPRGGETVMAPGHTGKICLGLVANMPPRLGAELVYEFTNSKTSEGARVYRLHIPTRTEE